MASLAGCYGSGTEGVEIMGNQSIAQNLDVQAFYDAGVPEDISIELTAGPEETDARAESFVTVLDAQQEKPDIMVMDNGWTIPFIARENIVNLEAELDDSFVDRVRSESFEMLVETGSHPETGELWALPFFPDFPTMQYRKDLFREEGYTDSEFDRWSTDPPSWAEWSSAVADVHDGADVDYGYVWQADSYPGLSCCTFNELMSSYGGAYFGGLDTLFGPVGERPITVEEPPVIEALNVGRDMVHGTSDATQDIAQCSPNVVFGWAEQETDGAFVGDANAVAMRNWVYTIGLADDQFTGDQELGVMPMPYGVPESEARYDGLGGTAAALGGWLIGVNPNTTDLESTLEVIRAFHSEEVQEAQLNGPGFLPHQPDLVERLAGDHPAFGDYTETLRLTGDNTVARPVTPVWSQQTQQAYQEINDALQRRKSPSEAMNDLATALGELENI
ncbi:extracellular solute-binding protein [Halohasta salina]|uniref:extracellular solute-binding protein n=1 Tax=Halohasta salina TaxID=2961621 RepID=UPI0020A2C39E|nr:extracellular solute-binding protein [Halohasta salina]